jgi:7-carboxy-7-deazaguanine synthase
MNTLSKDAKLRVYSIFSSINGEVCKMHQGSMCTFLRLAGCSANCSFCDTKYASNPESGKSYSLPDLVKELNKMGNMNVTITGGEPMEQKESLIPLVNWMSLIGYKISIETNGLIPFSRFEFSSTGWLSFVVDIKMEKVHQICDYLKMGLTSNDFLKVVVGNKRDFRMSLYMTDCLRQHGCMAKVAYSPMYGQVTANELVEWMKEYNQVDAILSVQLHKVLNLGEAK